MGVSSLLGALGGVSIVFGLASLNIRMYTDEPSNEA